MDNQLPSPSSPVSPETPVGSTPEKLQPNVPPAAETATGGGPSTPAPKLSAADVAVAIAATPATGTSKAAAAAVTPLVAGDVDVIEPEWVDKAEAVVRAHQGDPYAEEEAIETLQEDYLKKRYGISVADSEADSTKPEVT